MCSTLSKREIEILTHYQLTNFRLFQIERFADSNLKYEENGRKLFNPVENTVGKGDIARYEQYLLFPQCFQKACFPGVSKDVILWEWVSILLFVVCKFFDLGSVQNIVIWERVESRLFTLFIYL